MADRKPVSERRYGTSISLSEEESALLTALSIRFDCSRSEAVRRGLQLLDASSITRDE